MTERAPRAFVVMPFGTKEVTIPASSGSAAKAVMIDFDALYRELIGPALTKAGCEPFRADEEASPGDIRTDMFFELITADIVVADVTSMNVNVYYELGIRHTATPEGAIVIRGAAGYLPFDIAPDRVFSYDGLLWAQGTVRDPAQVASEVEKLYGILSGALAARETTVASPLYSHLPGLEPVDWRHVQTARALYYKQALDEWRGRMKRAQQDGRPGDILTLADDAPTPYHEGQLLSAASKGLLDLERYDLALEVINRGLCCVSQKDSAELHCRRGLVLNRLGRTSEAEQCVNNVLKTHAGWEEIQGALGRVYKDMWLARWKDLGSVEERQNAAALHSPLAKQAVESYDAAARQDLNAYYTGINVITLTHLLWHLEKAGKRVSKPGIADLEARVVAVRLAAETQAAKSGENALWAKATLAELALITGDTDGAVGLYCDAGARPGVTLFMLDSMLYQLSLLASLGFKADAAAKCIESLQACFSAAAPKSRRFEKVVLFSGHMVDLPSRLNARFPEANAEDVSKAIGARLEQIGIGPNDLAICGAARGGDILFAEQCKTRGAHVRLLIPLPEDEFIAQSVRVPGGSSWEARYHNLRNACEVWFQHERLGKPAPEQSVFCRNNLWMLHTGRVEAQPGALYALLVWNGVPTGDGPGGTSDFAARLNQIGATVPAPIDPLRPIG